MEDPNGGYPRPVPEERMGERRSLPRRDLHESGGVCSWGPEAKVDRGAGTFVSHRFPRYCAQVVL